MKAQVTRVIAGFYDLWIPESNTFFNLLKCNGNLRNNKMSPLVGDFVDFEQEGFIYNIHPRKNFFIRPKVANIDKAIVCMSIEEPNFSSRLLDKFLLIVEQKQIQPIIIITKKDLNNNYKTILKDYIDMNYPIFFVDNSNFSLDQKLYKMLENQLIFIMGQTGVGKTSFINNLTNNSFKTQAISKSLNRGKHTTRVVQIVFSNKIKIIDTPGFSSFDIEISKNDLPKAFSHFRYLSQFCKFSSCFHHLEPEQDCKVKQELKNKQIPQSRYENYIYFLTHHENKTY
ncbi:ribosome small subunit-dependent GTPase A [Mycoplasma sp. 1654_15]|uniref:ribosome small subunit-dependent GTPase A n=1 Tax=Mycoplasma sp. 1654_15 TaxID=2725994 RepID=UPI001449DE6A|nr:ribosome small subunit-dependent GTPase A [Mycoplasma sp. 1654_15]QJB71180.1 ribosome small subunit-dependent GTPase A [Mycoplasma sp. 1654_15]